jgi:UDP-N-acetylmuramoyl-L-alanyl-D-glutamate--2,6-diaminopimelate ligase
MKALSSIIISAQNIQIVGNPDVMVSSLTLDSRSVQPNGLYAALKGTQSDGHTYISSAIEKGASVILHSEAIEYQEGVTYIKTNEVEEALGQISLQFYDEAANHIVIVGTTGTNGKTTVSTLLFELFTRLGYQCGLVSTVENRIIDTIIPSTHTTPNVIALHELFHKMYEAGCTHCFMEVSSHALDQKRVAGVTFAGAVFTNISHDHLDYHKTFDNYIRAKKLLFDHLRPEAFALTNKDDKNGAIMLQNCKASRYSYGLRHR